VISYNNGLSWSVLGNGLPVAMLEFNQAQAAVGVNNNNGNVYCVWAGADPDHTDTFWFDDLQKEQFGDTQIKFAVYFKKYGQWSDWKNIAVIPGYNEWLVRAESITSNQIYYNPVWGNKLKIVKYYQMSPDIVVDSSGTIHVCWYGPDPDHTGPVIRYTYSSDEGVSWAPLKEIYGVEDTTNDVYQGSDTNAPVATNRFFAQVRPNIMLDANERLYIFFEMQNQSLIWSSEKQYQKAAYVHSTDNFNTVLPVTGPMQLCIDEKIEKYPDAALGSDGKIHVAYCGNQGWNNPSGNKDFENMGRQVRYATVDTANPDSVPVDEALNITAYTNWEQRYPQLVLDNNNQPTIIWTGNNSEYSVYDGGDPGTENELGTDTNTATNMDNFTGFYIMTKTKTGSGTSPDNWSDMQVLGKGYNISVCKGDYKNIAMFYMLESGNREFDIKAASYGLDRGTGDNRPDLGHRLNGPWKQRLFTVPNVADVASGQKVMICFEVLTDSFVEIGIKNSLGQTVLQLLEHAPYAQGVHYVTWTGKDLNGKLVERGAYVLYMVNETTGDKTKTTLYIK
ncbi:MAG TPA: hypothetical protein VKS21_08670, partial [Spirochaetota bacterium]|nr:hypothetical protein [Spirochaetota bacterium]